MRRNGLKVEIINMGGGSRGAQELQAGNIDLMRVGMSSVVQANRTGGDLRLIASMSNVIRFVVVTAPGVKTAADLKGGVIGVSTFGSESDSTVTLALERFGMTRADVTVKEYGGGSQAAGGGASRRDQGDRDQRADHQPGARAGRQRPDRSRRRADSLAVQRRGGAARRPRRPGASSSRGSCKAVIEGNYLALTDADARQGGAGARSSS